MCGSQNIVKKIYCKDNLVKKHIRRIMSNKKARRIIAFVTLVVVLACSYTLFGIYQNVQKMAATPEAEPYFPDYPAVNTQGKDAAQIKRGEYLAKAGDCIACHTNTLEKGKPFAGGLPMRTPFGTIYVPNITPDKETGLGNWTEEQFIRAMREGISEHGHYYYPAFPYLFFSKVRTQDLKDLKVYLDSIPAVHQENRKNEMVFPFNFRILQLGWRLLFFYPENRKPYEDQPSLSAELNRGAYLTQGLGHCAMCHSPSYTLISDVLPLGAPIEKYNFTGSKVQGYLAPNITSANLSTVSDLEIVEVFTKDKLIGGGKVIGPMQEVNHNSLRYLTNEDLLAIAKYLKSVHSQTPPKPKGGPGKGIYDEYCSGCHATGSGGAPKFGDSATWDNLKKDGIEKVYANAIKGINGMPAKGTCISCSEDEIKQAVDYMISGTAGGAVMTPVPKMKELSLEDGKAIYTANCSVCHNTGFKNAPIPGDAKTWKPILDKGFIDTYIDVATGQKGHPPRGACPDCTDDQLKAAVKYMMQQSSTNKKYNLW
jgi:cytochrome c5